MLFGTIVCSDYQYYHYSYHYRLPKYWCALYLWVSKKVQVCTKTMISGILDNRQ